VPFTESVNVTVENYGKGADVLFGSTAFYYLLPEAATLVWTGAAGNTWDSSQAANWSQGGSPEAYWDRDHVIFDDTAAGAPLVEITDTVTPGSVLIRSDTVHFEFAGAGSIAGPCGLTKNGGGVLTIATSNAYTGETQINAGTLVVAAEGALGASTVRLGDTTGSNDASLLVAAALTVDRDITVQDDGSGAPGRTLGGIHTAGTAVFSGLIAMEADLLLTAEPGGTVRLAGALDNADGHTLTKIGGGTAIVDCIQTHGPGALLKIESGVVYLNTDAGTAGAANLFVWVTGAELYVGSDQHLETLAISDGGLVRFTGAHTVVVKHLVMDGVDFGTATLTPEPATLALVTLGGLVALVRRRGKGAKKGKRCQAPFPRPPRTC